MLLVAGHPEYVTVPVECRYDPPYRAGYPEYVLPVDMTHPRAGYPENGSPTLPDLEAELKVLPAPDQQPGVIATQGQEILPVTVNKDY